MHLNLTVAISGHLLLSASSAFCLTACLHLTEKLFVLSESPPPPLSMFTVNVSSITACVHCLAAKP